MSIPEEGQTASEIIDLQASLDSSLAVCNTISDSECNFLGSGGTSLTNVVTGNGNGVPLWYILRAIFKNISNQTHGWTWWENVSTTSCILLQDIILNGTLQLACRNTLLLSNCNVHSQQYGSWSVDSHRSRNLTKINLVEKGFHISQRVNSNAYLTNFTLRNWIIGVITNLSWQVESAGQASCTGCNQLTITCIGLLSSGETSIHTHGPETATIHGWLYTTSERIHTRIANLLYILICTLYIKRSIQTLLWQVATLWETCYSLLYAGIVLFESSLNLFIAHNYYFPPIFLLLGLFT